MSSTKKGKNPDKGGGSDKPAKPKPQLENTLVPSTIPSHTTHLSTPLSFTLLVTGALLSLGIRLLIP
ncbi:hypothetical protein QBC34DRAFT_385488 [Podospora aff. communis PSN243]|uniref:Uncharacterized protein n=1 Tax=Podospora aff. communis PSN243 TaxID=3040156 RepID=A0AAV9G7T5_9PEZI|nr:hypothetical protein QBC34DRAFT_385488 [Podospora aff. communis PSN243]